MRIAIVAAAALTASAASAADPIKGLTVHEWGVFRVHADAESANADARAVWDALPGFVYGQVKGRKLPMHWPSLEIRDKPVIFFHTGREADVSLRVDFPGGMPGVWWPGTQEQAVTDGRLAGAETGKPAGHLQWRLHVGGRGPVPPAVADGHWIGRLRKVDAAHVSAAVGERGFGRENEGFVYYDGVFPRGRWVDVAARADAVSLTNRAAHPVFDVTVVDRRTEGKVRVGRIGELGAGAEMKAVEFADADPAAFAAEAAGTLTKQLAAAGLNPDEAASLTDLYRGDFFEAPGLQVFYRIPQAEYDRLLPMTLTPPAEKTVRVGLVFHPWHFPELAERVAALVRELDAEEFDAREAASRRLEELGPRAFPHLVRIRRDRLPAEVRDRIERLLDRHRPTYGGGT